LGFSYLFGASEADVWGLGFRVQGLGFSYLFGASEAVVSIRKHLDFVPRSCPMLWMPLFVV
jgi:hypothetical protein